MNTERIMEMDKDEKLIEKLNKFCDELTAEQEDFMIESQLEEMRMRGEYEDEE